MLSNRINNPYYNGNNNNLLWLQFAIYVHGRTSKNSDELRACIEKAYVVVKLCNLQCVTNSYSSYSWQEAVSDPVAKYWKNHLLNAYMFFQVLERQGKNLL